MLYALCTMLSIAFKQCAPASFLVSAHLVITAGALALRSRQVLLLQQMLPCVISRYLRRWYKSMLQILLVLAV